ncbi:hypothetical protein ACJRO7_013548 [Eucalyptus globulus]|uniref:Uncharacterized protein n=1 Tax=Eucalyptus globulus TaxID=34317 RepID=A0ABD3KXZ9_EUCGL
MASRTEASSSSSRTCLCSPTNHPGSFRCNLHKNSAAGAADRRAGRHVPSPERREPGTLSRDNVIRALLLQIIKPSRHDLRRKRSFEPKPSRFCLMNGVAVS